MKDFQFQPATFIPFRDVDVLERVRRISRSEIAKHPNHALTVAVVRDSAVGFIQFSDMIARIEEANRDNRHVTFILGNPNPGYADLAVMINRLHVDCRRLWIINMDEWADEAGNTAPESYPAGFMHAMKKYFYNQLDPSLRPPEHQVIGPTTQNIGDLPRMIAELGGADACYSGTGWSGHIAFIDPDCPEFDAPLERWVTLGPRIVTLSPYTIFQNSLHASFGRCGDTAAVPPKAATLGPADVIAARFRMDRSAITIGGSATSWQRLMTRLVLHGPVTPRVPASILQTVPTTFIIAESVASDITYADYAGY